ncbi:MAG TPA: methylated-DNA--[protein]-cysteine S-methyltransferase [Saprospiraceae bacterium]|nr:methylated-DNA--[protein]-cysteine S-methyltransferase [Saprospiraceae bacterium]
MNSKIFVKNWQSPLGDLIIGTYDDQLCLCDWSYRMQRKQIDHRLQTHFNAAYENKEHPVIEQAIVQLQQYFQRERTKFDLPLLMVGTTFQQKVWEQLMHIPYGKTISYQELAQNLHDEKVIRAAASANGANAISIIIPCHRVVGKNGALVGYAGGTLAKQKLLAIESPVKQLSLFEN